MSEERDKDYARFYTERGVRYSFLELERVAQDELLAAEQQPLISRMFGGLRMFEMKVSNLLAVEMPRVYEKMQKDLSGYPVDYRRQYKGSEVDCLFERFNIIDRYYVRSGAGSLNKQARQSEYVDMSFGKLSPEDWLYSWATERLAKNMNFIIAITGENGSGKSYAGLDIAEHLDPSFNYAAVRERIHFNTLDLISFVNSYDGEPWVIGMYDDTSVGANSRNWKSELSTFLAGIAQSFRFKHVCLIITVPLLKNADSQLRENVHLLLENEVDDQNNPIQGSFVPSIPKIIDGSQDLRAPRVKSDEVNGSIDGIHFQLPSLSLSLAYEQLKKEKLGEAYAEMEETARAQREYERQRKEKIFSGLRGYDGPGRRLLCDTCGHEWVYRGRNMSARCPRCGARVDAGDE